MAKLKVTKKSLQSDIKWTKEYIYAVKQYHAEGNYKLAAEFANEISAMWGTIQGDFLAVAEANEEEQD